MISATFEVTKADLVNCSCQFLWSSEVYLEANQTYFFVKKVNDSKLISIFVSSVIDVRLGSKYVSDLCQRISDPNLVIKSGIQPSQHTKFYHQIAFWKHTVKVQNPPLYERLIHEYTNANVELVNRIENQVKLANLFFHQHLIYSQYSCQQPILKINLMKN